MVVALAMASRHASACVPCGSQMHQARTSANSSGAAAIMAALAASVCDGVIAEKFFAGLYMTSFSFQISPFRFACQGPGVCLVVVVLIGLFLSPGLSVAGPVRRLVFKFYDLRSSARRCVCRGKRRFQCRALRLPAAWVEAVRMRRRGSGGSPGGLQSANEAPRGWRRW